jgi:hypothetical protein
MLSQLLMWVAVGIICACATALLLARDWRWNLGFLAALYVGAGILASLHWPPGMAAALLVTGWMSEAALGMTLTSLPSPSGPVEEAWPQGRAFRAFMAGMILVLAIGITPRVRTLMAGMESPVVAGAVVLIGMGFLQLGTSTQLIRIIFGLLTVLAGFQVFYAAVEGSILVAGLLSVVVLGLGLVGAYLLNAGVPEDQG